MDVEKGKVFFIINLDFSITVIKKPVSLSTSFSVRK